MQVKDLIITGDARIIGNLYTKDGLVSGGSAGGSGGDGNSGLTYTLSKSGSTITLTGSDGSVSSVTDTDTDTDTNTHYTTGITAGASGTTSNSATSNPYIKVKDDSTHRGQIQIKGGGATSVSSDGSGVITISSTDNNTTYSAATQGVAGLMSATDKTKLDGIATGANNYTLPTATSSTLGGVKVGSNINVSSGTISLTKANVVAALGYTPPTQDTNTTYSVATQSANGLMSASDKKKLDGVAAGANAYTHPTSSGNKHIPSGGSSGQILRWGSDGTAVWGNDNNTTYTLGSFGITVSANELNCCKGASTNIPNQISLLWERLVYGEDRNIIKKGVGGKNNIWTYEIYGDYSVVLYANIPVNNLQINQSFGNLYRSLAAFSEAEYAFPFPLNVTNPICTIEYQQTNNVGAWSMVGSVCTSTQPPGVYLIRPTTGTTSGLISIVVRGSITEDTFINYF